MTVKWNGEIPDTLKISILYEHLGMRKLCSKWVTRLLTVDQKQQRVDDSEHCLDLFKRNKKDFFMRYVTMDETWIHHYTPESNPQSTEWTATCESRLRRPKTQESSGNILDSYGIIFIDYAEKGKTINSEYYIKLLVRLKAEIAKNGPKWTRKKCSFLKTMHHVTSQWLRWQNCMNWSSNCFLIHRILQIWPPATIMYSHTSKKC